MHKKYIVYVLGNDSTQVKHYHKSHPLTRKVIYSGNNLKLILQSLHKNCPPRARNPHTLTQCISIEDKIKAITKNGLSLIQRTQADRNMQICSTYC